MSLGFFLMNDMVKRLDFDVGVEDAWFSRS